MLIAPQALASEWTGAVGTDWNTAGNWDTNSVPTSADTVQIGTLANGNPANDAVISTGNSTVGALQMGTNTTSTGDLTVIGAGAGLTVSGTSAIGFAPLSTGRLSVLDGAFLDTDYLLLGDGGDGTLTIDNGSTVQVSQAVSVGLHASGTGTINISDAGSLFYVGNDIDLGAQGTGILNVSLGAEANIGGNLSLGRVAGGTGIVTVDGVDSGNNASELQVANTLTVGDVGTGILTVSNGGHVVDANGVIGSTTGAGTATVTGPNSVWDNTTSLIIGDLGLAALTVDDGGTVSSGDYIFVGNQLGSDATVTVMNGGLLTAVNGLYIGKADISVTNGGDVSTGITYIGTQPNTTSHVIVDGSGSTWTANDVGGAFVVGFAGDAALTVSNGAAVTAQNNLLIAYSTGTSALVTVTGPGSTLDITHDLFIGGDSANFGQGDLVISDGGNVVVDHGIVQVGIGGGPLSRLHIGAYVGSPAAAPGTLTADEIFLGSGGGGLAFNHTSQNYTFAPEISGFGSVNVYAGTTILTADSTGFGGSTIIQGGKLVVNGALGGTVYLENDGILGGSGTLAGDVQVGVMGPGTVAPGNSIGTLNIGGNLTFNSGSTYEVEVDAAGQADSINVAGAAVLDGGVSVLAGAGNYAPATDYTILSATGGVTGTFADGVTSNLAFLDPSLTYDANNVYLHLIRNNIGFADIGSTPNQIASGIGIESLGAGNPVYDVVLTLSQSQALDAYDQLSGEVHASVLTGLVDDSRFVREAMNGRLRATQVGREPGFWTHGFGSWGHVGGDGNAARFGRSTGGFLIGADGEVFGDARLGMIAGYSHSSFEVNGRGSAASSDNYHLGLYGSAQLDAVAWRSGLAYSWNDIDTTRNVAFPGFSDRLKGGYDAGTFQAFTEFSYGIEIDAAKAEPFVNLAHVNVGSNGFGESGGASALSGDGESFNATFTTVGLRASKDFRVDDMAVTARGMLGWRHAFGDMAPQATLSYLAGGDPFTISGVPIDRDVAIVEAGLDLAVTAGTTIGIAYNGQFGSDLADQSFKADLNVKF